MTIAMVNETLADCGYQLNPKQTKVRIENEKGDLITYKSTVRGALKFVLSRNSGRISGMDEDALFKLFLADGPTPPPKPGSTELTPELKAELVQKARSAWEYVAMDYLQDCQDHSCDAAEAREVAGDRVEDERFFDLTHAQQEEILAEAIPHNQSI